MMTEGPANKNQRLDEPVDAPPEFQISEDNMKLLSDNSKKLRAFDDELEKEICELQFEFEKKKVPYYNERQEIIKKINGFWAEVFSNHTFLSQFLGDSSSMTVVKCIIGIDIEILTYTRRSYKITFTFKANEFFSSDKVAKTFCTEFDKPNEITNTQIAWTAEWRENTEKLITESSFISWLVNTNEPATDFVAQAMRDSMWPHAISYLKEYLGKGPEVVVDMNDDLVKGDD